MAWLQEKIQHVVDYLRRRPRGCLGLCGCSVAQSDGLPLEKAEARGRNATEAARRQGRPGRPGRRRGYRVTTWTSRATFQPMTR